ncbi:hypothetical protein HUA78_44830 [Myxococcus sp. CA033]|uniref:hypothetical protein n=1 Tax=Myxococcus sp. CA033 TaxID=2741516 RepID=UPI00157A56E5|nr:hypothetical protein [Myxococcus sp. CA033]NTX41580.1 hypothetical protein [Myxococcus sp. CA033]
MKRNGLFRRGFLLAAALASTGCSDSLDDGQTPINLAPPSLAEAQLSLQRIDQLYESDPAAALDATQKLRPKLDELNNLVARVEMAPAHFVEFYDVQPGGLLVVERGPVEDGRFLRDQEGTDRSAVALYRRLTGGATPPDALVRAESRREAPDDFHLPAWDAAVPSLDFSEGFAPDPGAQTGDSVTQSWTSDQGPLWRDSACYKWGEFFDCLPNRTGNGAASRNAKTAFIQAAPYRGSLRLQLSYDNVARGAWAVFAGEMASYWWHSASYWACPGGQACGVQEYYIRNHRWDVLDADGDGYHLTWAFRSNCNWISCDTPPF